jgi:hypothetical protein
MEFELPVRNSLNFEPKSLISVGETLKYKMTESAVEKYIPIYMKGYMRKEG